MECHDRDRLSDEAFDFLVDHFTKVIEEEEVIHIFDGWGDGSYSVLSILPVEETDAFCSFMFDVSDDM